LPHENHTLAPFLVLLSSCPHQLANFGGSAFAPPAAKFCWLKNFAGGGILPVAAIPCHTLDSGSMLLGASLL
jgi:hypothetical protein